MTSTAIVPETPAPVNPRTKECLTCGRAAVGSNYCATCRAQGAGCSPFTVEQSNGFAPRKRTLPKPSKRETYAAGCCRLAHQGRLNGAVTAPVLGETYEHELCWCVTSQSSPGGYTVVHNTAGQWWACSCEAHTGNKLCAHISLIRTWVTECPTCSSDLLVYADRLTGGTPREYSGAVRCTGGCGLIADLTSEEAEAMQEAHLGVHTLPVLGLLLVVVRRLDRAAEGQAA